MAIDVIGAILRVVLDHEDEQSLRQKPRLEDSSPVLVRDDALAAVADRLDHRDADVPGLLLDGVDHRLDPLTDHHSLDLDHVHLPFRTNKKPSGIRRIPKAPVPCETPSWASPEAA